MIYFWVSHIISGGEWGYHRVGFCSIWISRHNHLERPCGGRRSWRLAAAFISGSQISRWPHQDRVGAPTAAVKLLPNKGLAEAQAPLAACLALPVCYPPIPFWGSWSWPGKEAAGPCGSSYVQGCRVPPETGIFLCIKTSILYSICRSYLCRQFCPLILHFSLLNSTKIWGKRES